MGGTPCARRICQALVFAAAGILLCCIGMRDASAQNELIRQFKHNSWSYESGAPSFVTALAQSPDGYIWLAARGGLYRFDGVTFERMLYADSKDNGITPSRLLVSRTGTLWVGLPGALAYYREGRIHRVPSPKLGSIGQIAEDRDGVLWIRSVKPNDSLYRFEHGRFEQVGANWGLPQGWIGYILTARDGTTWMAAPGKLMFLRPGSRRFHVMDEDVNLYGSLAEDARGNIWFSGRAGTRLVRDASSPLAKPGKAIAYPAVPNIRGTQLLVDRDGWLWGATWSHGVFHIPLGKDASAPRTELDTFGVKDGLSADVTLSTLQDREGNIWIGTERGLDRFRATPVITETAIEPSAEGYLIASDAAGNVFIGAGDKIYEIAPRRAPRIIARWPEPLEAICASRDGATWLASSSHVGRLVNGSLQMVRPPAFTMPTYGCREDREGRVWFAIEEGRVLGRLPDGRWIDPLPPSSDYSPFLDIALGPEGHVVVNWGTENIRVLRERTISTFPQSSLGLGSISTVIEGRDALFVMGARGIGKWRGNRLQKLSTEAYPWMSMRGFLQTPQETWIIGTNGILRLSTRKLDHAFDHPGAELAYQRFDANDGLAADMQHVGYRGPQIARGGDGRLWFLTSQGVARIDPANLRKNMLPPPVAIRFVSAGGKTYVDPVKLSLPRGTTNLEIAYTALSLSVPGRVHFRYQLEGEDEFWIDPGTRREAFYTNLSPGRYRFRVIASNNDGVWNRTGVTLEIEIPPTFFQTTWFLLLCLIPVIALICLLYSLRLRHVAGQVRRQMATRMAERERIARDLHDTLMQSMHGLILRFQAVANGIPPELPARGQMEKVLERTVDVLVEARDRVQELRADSGQEDLESILMDVAEKQFTDPGVKVRVAVEGAPRRLHPVVLDEVTMIAREAFSNAAHHSQASQIDLVATFGRRVFAFGVADNGVGIDAETMAKGSKEGHFGLSGMRERASKIQAQIAIGSRAGKGTEIVLTIPARVAYQNKVENQRWFRRIFTRRPRAAG